MATLIRIVPGRKSSKGVPPIRLLKRYLLASILSNIVLLTILILQFIKG